jgi:hypothetical protein
MAGMKTDVKFDRGPSGKGELRCLKNGVKIVAEDGKIYEDISYDAVYCPLPEDAGQGKSYSPVYFRLNKGEDALYQVSPWGTETENEFFVRYVWIPHKEDEAPSTYMQKGKEVRYPSGYRDWKPERESFNIELEVIAGKMKGLYLKPSFGYMFVEDEETGKAMIEGHGSWFGRWASDLITLMRHAGFDFQSDSIEWSDNPSAVLSQLHEVLSNKDVPFRVKVVNGWVREFGGIPDGISIE